MIALLLSLVLAVQGIPVQAQQGGKVTGVLKDSAGKPIAGIRMAAIARPDSLAEAVTSAAMSSLSETDADGRYTLENIPPGKYYIAAGRLDLQTYYPGTPDMATAKELAITPGASLAGIDFTLGNSSFGRAATSGSFGLASPAVAIPLRVTIEGGGRVPLSGAGKITSVRLDMNGSAITVPVTGTVVNVPGPQTTAYRVTVENLPETYTVKSITYGTTDLLTNTLRLTPANFPSSASTSIVQLGNATLQMLPLIGAPNAAGATTTTTTVAQWAQLFQNQIQLQVNGNALTAGVMLSTSQPAVTPPSLLSITLAPTAPKPTSGVRVTGRANFGGARTIYLSGIPGAVYSDGTFEVYGVPPGRHTIVTRYNPAGLQPLAASVVVGDRDIDGITLVETPLLPPNSPASAPGTYPAGAVIPLAKVKVNLVNETSRQPIPEGTVFVRNGIYYFSPTVDADGHIEIPPLLPGTYELEIQIFAHAVIQQSIEVDDRDMNIEIVSKRLY